ncbi:hypothetical protein TTRE_0000563301 [Trichuris trichiura]|uniref:Uncharacterized protein n=1 Tax=Trichuris trichiura TaxID=36087 RepID=A0A077ZAC7_TRITR|nr:hypothetical protein TTRE_0000563301 [Trichuris trichiura]
MRAFENGSQGLLDREIRHLDYITSMQAERRHVSGKDNVVADALSREAYGAARTGPALSAKDIALAQSEDPELQWIKDHSSLRIERGPGCCLRITLYRLR